MLARFALLGVLYSSAYHPGQPEDPDVALAARMDPTTWSDGIVYNDDGDNHVLKKEGAVTLPSDRPYIEQYVTDILSPDSRVDAVTVCVNARAMYYPTAVAGGTLRGSLTPLSQQGSELASEPVRFLNAQHFYSGNHPGGPLLRDPYLYMINAIRGHGRPAIMTFRVNDVHSSVSSLKEQFWISNVSFRLNGSEGYDFGSNVAVVDHQIALITEALARYPWDGLELDFNRTPPFFDSSPALSEAQKIAIMTDFVTRAKAVLDAEAIAKGKPMLFGVRAPANASDSTAPTPAEARAFGCDLGAWADLGLLDYAVVSRYLSNSGPLNISAWKADIGNSIPVLGGVEWINGGTQADYNAQCAVVAAEGADGIYTMNFFAHGYISPYTPPPWGALSTMCAP